MKAAAIGSLLLALVACIQASITYEDVLNEEFELFKVEHGKSYVDENEEQVRLQIFKDNKELIDKHNERYAAGEETYEMGVNQFTDMLSWEFEQLVLTKFNMSAINDEDTQTYPTSYVELPSSIDWRAKGAVTAVKNQGQCGSCWAFAAAASLEAQVFIKTKKLVSLSEQNLVDCTRQYGNLGCCNGGWPIEALKYVRDNGGINTESSYPYEAIDNSCRYNKNNIGAKVSAIIEIARGSEAALASAVANKGPISVCIDASLFQHYQSGVFNEPSCSNQSTNHCVVVDGYGTDSVGGDYWLARNSWGENWGEDGYIRMARNRDNQCAIANYAIYPLI
ncbi:hypothetical protein KR093_003695 [Drosophila rubida]|uniref:cathepsin L n=1 Tax=Drosophila rubida TaxID=30044 RepID=A0AAD4K129_9MUSC|nr:hypothetical protein KR093_003695 [Drosophila rubida]